MREKILLYRSKKEKRVCLPEKYSQENKDAYRTFKERQFSRICRMISEYSVATYSFCQQHALQNLQKTQNVELQKCLIDDSEEKTPIAGYIDSNELPREIERILKIYGMDPLEDKFLNFHYKNNRIAEINDALKKQADFRKKCKQLRLYLPDTLEAVSYICENPEKQIEGYKYVVFIIVGINAVVEGDNAKNTLAPDHAAFYVADTYFDLDKEGLVPEGSLWTSLQGDRNLLYSAVLMRNKG